MAVCGTMAGCPVVCKAPKKNREEEFYERTNPFRKNALAIIIKMLELNDSSENTNKQLVDEILHSIFFLGRISLPPISPEMIVNDSELLDALKDCYPLPFELYSSQLPRRSPFSCVLDMTVFLEGPEKENKIIKKLQEIISPLNQDHLVSAAICVSKIKNNKNSVCRDYGVSMSRMGYVSRRIMISASCLEYWDSYVAGAVMTYHPNDTKHPSFDGTITLPERVSCETFKLFTGGKEYFSHRKSCHNLFGLKEKPKTFPYGNCAEAESVSNLFKNDTEVREQARPTSEKFTADNREMAAERVRLRKDLKECLKGKHRFIWDNQFYKPQPAVVELS